MYYKWLEKNWEEPLRSIESTTQINFINTCGKDYRYFFMSQLNVGTLNVGTTQFTGDSSTLNSAPAGTITAMLVEVLVQIIL